MATSHMTHRGPYGEQLSLREAIDRLVDGSLIRPTAWRAAVETGAGILPLDMYEEGNNLIVKAALPGLKPAEVKIQVQGDVLTISGESKQKHASHDQQRTYRLQEQSYGRLERSVALPVPVEADKAEAAFADGVLTLTLPKSRVTPPTRIAIKAPEAAPQVEAPVEASQVNATEPAPHDKAPEAAPQDNTPEAVPQGSK